MSFDFKPLPIAVAIVLLCAGATAFAADTPTTTDRSKKADTPTSADQPKEADLQLPETLVKGTRQSGGYGTEPVEQRLQELRESYPGTVNTVTPDELKRLKTHNQADVLARIPGVNYVDEDGRGLRPNIGLRGLSPQRSQYVLLLCDGVPCNTSIYSDSGSYYGVPPERVAGIEVVKGGSSLLYGPNTVGGAINYLYRPLSEKPFEAVLDLRGGSYDNFMSNLFASGTQGATRYGAEFMRKQGDSFRDNSAFEINDGDLRLGRRFNEDHDVQAHFSFYDEDSQTPGYLTPAQFAQDITLSNKPNDRMFNERIVGDIRSTHVLGEGRKFETLFYSSYNRRDWYIQNFANTTGQALANTNGQNLREFHVVGFEPKFSQNYDLGFLKNNTLEVGGRVYHDTLDRIVGTGPTPKSLSRGSGTITSDIGFNTLALAAYVQNEFRLTDRFSVTPGLRYEYIEQERKDILGDTEGSKFTDILLPGIGLKYSVAPETIAYANVSRAFRPPTFNDSFDPTTSASRDLDAGKAITYEVGFRSNPYEWLRLDAALFRFDFEDQVVISQNVASNFDTRSQGAEGTAQLGLIGLLRHLAPESGPNSDHELYLTGGFTVQDTEFLDGAFVGNELPFAPDQMYTFGARYEWRKQASVQLQGRRVDDQFTDNANTVAPSADGIIGVMPIYTVWDLNLNYDYKPLSVAAGVRNLFDEKYIAERNTFFRGVTAGPNRTFYVGLSVQY